MNYAEHKCDLQHANELIYALLDDMELGPDRLERMFSTLLTYPEA